MAVERSIGIYADGHQIGHTVSGTDGRVFGCVWSVQPRSYPSAKRQYQAACCALDAALEAVQAAAPNGRDYYPQGDGALQQAQHEHHTRVVVLATMRRAYEELIEHVLDAED